jgi:hypothetical protein
MDVKIQSQNQSYVIDQRSVCQSPSVSVTHLGHTTGSLLLSDSCGCVDVGRLL